MVNSLTEFASALLQPDLPLPSGLRTWNGSDPGARFAIYRNNVMASLIDALAESFPVTQQLVGEDFFRGMARIFVQTHPLKSRVLAWVGREFPAFIDQFQPVSTLAYLSDVARIEWLRICAYHAADQSSLDPQAMARPLADPDSLLHLQLHLHPSVHLLSSRFAVYSLWIAHHGLLDIATVNPAHAEAALVYRSGLDVKVMPLDAAQAHCIQRLLEKAPLTLAANEACVHNPAFDLGATLRLLVQQQLVVATAPCSHP
jgi:hypothetical protein